MMAARVGRLKVFYALAARGEKKTGKKNMRRADPQLSNFSKNAVKLSHVKYLMKLTVELED